MKKVTLLTCLILMGIMAFAQTKYITKSGSIGLYSHTAMEDVKAVNSHVASILDIESGNIIFTVLIKSFKFEKTLMEEHFNENYMESDKLPKSTFKGKIVDVKAVDFKKDGVYPVEVEGDLTIHGVSKTQKTPGTIEVKGGHIMAKSKFLINPEDYGIVIPGVVRDKIAQNMEITIDMDYELMK